jgi:hypothetical protein
MKIVCNATTQYIFFFHWWINFEKKYFFGLFFSFVSSQKNANVCPDLSCAPSISPYFFGFCWKTDHYSYKWSLDKNKTHEKEEKNNFLPCFMQNVAKTVLIHFLTNLNLKDLSQDVGYNIFILFISQCLQKFR